MVNISSKKQINQIYFLQYLWMLDNFLLKEFILKVQNLKRKAETVFLMDVFKKLKCEKVNVHVSALWLIL